MSTAYCGKKPLGLHRSQRQTPKKRRRTLVDCETTVLSVTEGSRFSSGVEYKGMNSKCKRKSMPAVLPREAWRKMKFYVLLKQILTNAQPTYKASWATLSGTLVLNLMVGWPLELLKFFSWGNYYDACTHQFVWLFLITLPPQKVAMRTTEVKHTPLEQSCSVCNLFVINHSLF